MPPRYIQVAPHLKPAGASGAELLEIERKKASFSATDLSRYLHGDAFLERQARLVEILENDPYTRKDDLNYMSTVDKLRYALAKDKRLAQLADEHNWDRDTANHAEALCDAPGPFGLHKSMFLVTLENMATEEQRKLFLEPALKYDIIGCYAQTELGHGSNVQGLETTATYDESTQEFVINSPTLTSSKWWIGSLGVAATHAVVMARLVLKGKLMGPTPFVVQIRDLKTREPLPGVTVGLIGRKLGYATTDNGMLLFDHVRIPHINMLARFARVELDTAVYVPPQNAALTYGTLTFVRANIVQQARTVLMRSACVAIRYCAIRRQFADKDAPIFEGGKPVENQVLNYTMVQARIFPILAKAFAFHYTARYMFDLYKLNMEGVNKGDLSLLAETHASSSGLKALTTIEAAEAIETCRRACGGHGFSLESGLGTFYTDYLPNVTWEGDSYMLSQQTSRYLLKQMRELNKDIDSEKLTGFTASYMRRYLRNKDESAAIEFSGDLYDPMMFVKAFGHRAAYLVSETLALRDGPAKRTWNSLLVDLYKATKAHSQALIVYNFSMAILKDEELNSKPAIRTVVQQLFLLYCCTTMELEGAEFMASGYVTAKQYGMLGTKIQELMALIRPQAVTLVDSFAIPDYLLNSALGHSSGKVYEKLIDHAVRDPINSTRWNVDIHDLDTLDMDGVLPPSKL